MIRKVFSLAMRHFRDTDEADDIRQQVFLSVYKHISKFKRESKFSTWLYKITRNAIRYRWKEIIVYRQRVERLLEEQDGKKTTLPIPADQLERLEAADLRRRIYDVLNCLPEEDHKIIVLRFLKGMTCEQIMASENLKLSTVKMRIKRALSKFRRHIHKTENSSPGHFRKRPATIKIPGSRPGIFYL